jgi:hypothetical protein
MLPVVLVLFLLTSSVFSAELPLWFFEPADISGEGALGFAAESWKGSEYSLLLAKCRALKSYLLSKGHRDNLRCPSQFDELTTKQIEKLKKDLSEKIKKENLKFEFKVVKLNDYPTKIFLAYVYKQKKISYPYALESFPCSLQRCQPSYLCDPLREGYLATIGVAPVSFSFQEQYSGAIRNAMENLLLLLNTKVELKESELKNSVLGFSSFYVYLNNSRVLPKKSSIPTRFVVRGICIDDEGNLFVYLIVPDLPVKKFHFSFPPCWVETPGCVREPLAVGVAKKGVGGIKTQLKVSLKKALTELAKIQGANVKEIDFEKGKTLYTGTVTETNQTVSSALVGVYLSKDGFLFTAVSPLNSLKRRGER